jgi:hypothetical protein
MSSHQKMGKIGLLALHPRTAISPPLVAYYVGKYWRPNKNKWCLLELLLSRELLYKKSGELGV